MKDLNHVRMITTNFSTLQGLKMVPLGLLLLVISLWANAHHGTARDFLFPGGCVVAAFFIYWLVNRFYTQNYGIVLPTLKQRMREWILMLIGAVAGLAAFWFDVSIKSPVSLLGVVIAGAILADYVRIAWQVKGRALIYYPAAALLMILLSFLPIFGINWWKPIGIKALLLGVTIVTGLLFIIFGVLGHISLVNWLPPTAEVNNEQRL
jgi:hypothetical protein